MSKERKVQWCYAWDIKGEPDTDVKHILVKQIGDGGIVMNSEVSAEQYLKGDFHERDIHKYDFIQIIPEETEAERMAREFVEKWGGKKLVHKNNSSNYVKYFEYVGPSNDKSCKVKFTQHNGQVFIGAHGYSDEVVEYQPPAPDLVTTEDLVGCQIKNKHGQLWTVLHSERGGITYGVNVSTIKQIHDWGTQFRYGPKEPWLSLDKRDWQGVES